MPSQDEIAQRVRPHLTKLYRLAYRLTGNKPDAEDLVQDVLVKVFARPEDLMAVRIPGQWLGRVLYNQFVDDRRRYGRRAVRLVDDASVEQMSDAPEAGPEAQAGVAQVQHALVRALDQLSEDHRVVVLLHDSEGYTLTEIEDVTGTPVGTLKSRLHRARARLSEILKKDGTLSAPGACIELDGVKTDAV